MQWKQMGGQTGKECVLQITPSIILGLEKKIPYGTCTEEEFYYVCISIKNL